MKIKTAFLKAQIAYETAFLNYLPFKMKMAFLKVIQTAFLNFLSLKMKMDFLKVLEENLLSTFENEDGFSEGSKGECAIYL